ncbi:MAG: DUF493 family protein, partial [Myxococcales bacterium]
MSAPSENGQADDEQARARALALLEAVHQFPGEYAVTVIAFNQEAITEAIRQAARAGQAAGGSERKIDGGGGGDGARGDDGETVFVAYEARSSREGKYLSHRFTVRVAHAREVLDLYERLRAL